MDRQRWRGSASDGSIGGCRGTTVAEAGGATTNKDLFDDDANDLDQDDMAAAYFAKQANKQREEERQNETVLQNWATIILRQQKVRSICERRRPEPVAIVMAVDEPPKWESSSNKKSLSLAEELLMEFQRIVVQS